MERYINKINFWRSIVILILYIVFTIVVAVPLMFLPLENYISGFDNNIAQAIGYFFSLLLTIFAAYKIYVFKTDQSDQAGMWTYFNFSMGKKTKYINIVIVTMVMILWVDFFTSLIPMHELFKKLFEEAFNLSFASIFTIAIMAPIFEEMLARGLVLEGFTNRYSATKSVILSAIFFGLIHLNPWQFIGGFISGLFLGYLYYKSRSLGASIFVHFLNNSLSVLVMLKYPDVNLSFRDIIGDTNYYMALVLSIPSVYIILKKLNKQLNKEYKTASYEIGNSNQQS